VDPVYAGSKYNDHCIDLLTKNTVTPLLFLRPPTSNNLAKEPKYIKVSESFFQRDWNDRINIMSAFALDWQSTAGRAGTLELRLHKSLHHRHRTGIGHTTHSI